MGCILVSGEVNGCWYIVLPPECEMIAKMEMILRYIDATMDGRECQWGKPAI